MKRQKFDAQKRIAKLRRDERKGLHKARRNRLRRRIRHFEHRQTFFRRRQNPTRQDILRNMLDETFPLHEVDVPEKLCLVSAPEETLEFLDQLNGSLEKKDVRNLSVSHFFSRKLELAASHLFDETIRRHKEKLMKQGGALYLRGETSRVRAVNNFLVAMGFLRTMKIPLSQINMSFDADYKDKYKLFRSDGSKANPDAKGIVGGRLVNYFNQCLHNFRVGLTPKGMSHLADAVGEIIGNAEEHAGPECEWTILGCFEKDTRTVSFSILNTGLSIYESLSGPGSTSREVLEKIEEVILSHRGTMERLGSLLQPSESKEPIWNVMALQEGISSKRTLTGEASTRGMGLMDVLEFLHELKSKQEDGYLSIISGHSYIYVDFTYPIRRVEIDGEERRQIAFNKDESLHMPQDGHKVRYLRTPFKGTIITGSFKISDSYVISTT